MKRFYFLVIYFFIAHQLFSITFSIRNQVLHYENELYYVIYQNDTFRVDTTTLIIKYLSYLENSAILEIENDHGLARNHEFITGFILYNNASNKQFHTLYLDLADLPEIEILEFNTEIKFCNDPMIPDDELYPYQWYLDRINVPEAWEITTGNENVIIAILDSGTDWEHEDIGPGDDGYENVFVNPNDPWSNWDDTCSGDKNDNDGNGYVDDWKGYGKTIECPGYGELYNDSREYSLDILEGIYGVGSPDAATIWRHGTFISGIIGAKTNNDNYISGIACGWGNKGVSMLYINIGHAGKEIIPVSEVEQAIEYVIGLGNNKPKIIQMAFITVNNPSLAQLIHDATFWHGIFFVGAAGNDGNNGLSYPAGDPYVFGVGATDTNDYRRTDSNYGSDLDLCTPGQNITGLEPDNQYGTFEGRTSAASAIVSGTVGLILSANPNLTSIPFLAYDKIKEILHSTAEKVHDGEPNYNYVNGRCNYVGYGLLDACKAVREALRLTGKTNITSNETWYDDKVFSNDVIIHPQCTLTIKNTVKMGTYLDEQGNEHKAKIIVMRGEESAGIQKSAGTLIIDGGKLTNLENCDDPDVLWGGIEVWGNKNKSQYKDGINWQGKVELKNGAKIENAEIGILLGKTGDEQYNYYAGGIIRAENNGDPDEPCAEFINNKTSIFFRPYKNFIPNSNPVVYADNLGYINNCFFDINSNYIAGAWWDEQIYMFNVNGVKIRGCTFENNQSPSPLGHGINAWGAGFRVEGLCNSNTIPCSPGDFDPCTFSNFAKGINNNSAWNRAVTVKDAIFTENTVGVKLTNVHNASILFNEFTIGKTQQGEEDECEGKGQKAAAYGIDMENCTGFAIEENTFAPGGTGNEYVGIRVNNCPSRHDIIYLNEFTGLSYGNYAYGINRSVPGDDQTGIEYRCNSNTNNSIDFIVTGVDQYDAMIRTDQGSPNLSSGNTFSTSATWHYRNEGLEKIDYYFWDGNSYQIPDMERVYSIDDLYFDDIEADENTCLSHYGSSGGGTGGRIILTEGEKLEREQMYLQNLSDYQNVKALFDNLKDGGNTEALQTEIETSWPTDMWELRADLLGKSPYLSKEVLMTAADKTDVLPESVLFEILSANPDELKEADLISYLENKEQPLPQYMIDILQQLSFGVTYKTILKRQMAEYHAGKTQAALDMIRSILADTVLDMQQYRNWLDNLGGIGADKQIITSCLSEGNYTDAQALLNLLPTLYELEGQALSDFNDYKSLMQMQMTWKQQGRNIFELDSTEVNVLVDYAENSSGGAKSIARGILTLAYGYHYCDCLVNSDSSVVKSSKVIPTTSFDKMFGSDVTVKPNPAGDWTTFNYQLSGHSSEGIIEITDVSGAVIERFAITGKKGQKVWDTRKIKPGVYFYTLSVSGNTKSGKIVIYK